MASRPGASSSVAAPKRPPVEEPSAAPLKLPSRPELTVAFAKALDLGEGRDPGHAARVAYVGLQLAKACGLSQDKQRAAFYASLLHDAGAAPASAELCRVDGLNEEEIFRSDPDLSPQQLALDVATNEPDVVREVLRAHPALGSQRASDLGFAADVQGAVTSHHERWDGHGYPAALKGDAIPLLARIVAAADLVESLIAGEASPLAARRTLLATLAEHRGNSLDPELERHARELALSDVFWLGLHSEELSRELAAACREKPAEAGAAPDTVALFATVFSKLAYGKGEHTEGHGERTADLVVRLGEALGFGPARLELLRISALLHDVGVLGVPARILAKPDILSLTEMQTMRQHPTFSQLVLEELPGMADAAAWVGAHHERPDGKGYPEMLEDDQIPIEARIIALADTYVALTSPRPYRGALSHGDAEQVLLGGAGTQLDTKLVRVFCSLPPEPTSSRTARRSRRRR